VEAKPNQELTAGSVTFQAIPMNHVKHSMSAFGYKARIGDRTVAYTGDTMYCEEIYELGEGADVLVVDCTYTDGSGPEHMGLDDVKVIRKRLSPATTMVLTLTCPEHRS
jgi:ribonuclease BN (tRNA processing enzyme)